jgi:hypothetical protein
MIIANENNENYLWNIVKTIVKGAEEDQVAAEVIRAASVG